MRSKSTYSYAFSLCSLITLLLFSSNTSAQTPENKLTGIHWTPPSSLNQSMNELDQFAEFGFQVLEISYSVDPAIIDSASRRGFQILIRSNREFLTATHISDNFEGITDLYESLISTYLNQPQVRGLGVYSYSQSFDPDFIEQFDRIRSALPDSTGISFYEVTTGPFNAVDFALTEITTNQITENTGSVLYRKDYSPGDLQFLTRLMTGEEIDLVLIDSDWLFDALEDYPVFASTLYEYRLGSEWLLPLPEEEPESATFDWLILVFVLIWFSMGVHIRTIPTYSGLIVRYFTGHKFFVDDVMRYRERSAAYGIFLLFQHAAFTGVVASIFSRVFISETGIQALFHFLPQAGIFGQNHVSVFAVGFIIACLFQIIALAWLYLPSKSMNHVSQVLSLYTWTFHLDFLIVSVMLVTYLTGGSQVLIMIMGALFILNWLSAFLLTSMDSAKYLPEGRVSYVLLTFGVHTLVNIGLLILILSSSSIMDALELMIVI